MLAALVMLLWFLALVCSIASFVFFIMVVMQMFKRDQTNLGIICIVLLFCGGIGVLVAFVIGWMKATEWNLKKTMTYWTIALVLYFVFAGLAAVTGFAVAATMIHQEMDFDPNNMDFEFDIDDSQFEFQDGVTIPDDAAMPDDITIPDDVTIPEDAALPEESSPDQP